MRKLLFILPLLALPSAWGSIRFQRDPAKQLAPGNRANALRRPAIRDAMLYFYVTQFQKQAQISPEVYAKILPLMEEFVQNRLDISQRRTRAINQIRQAINRGAADEDLTRLAHEVDAADVEAQSNQDKFLSSVDPLLTPKQQAKLRLFQVMADNQIREYLNTVQSSNRGTQPAAPPQ